MVARDLQVRLVHAHGSDVEFVDGGQSSEVAKDTRCPLTVGAVKLGLRGEGHRGHARFGLEGPLGRHLPRLVLSSGGGLAAWGLGRQESGEHVGDDGFIAGLVGVQIFLQEG